jgi:lipoic acid synthetase
LNLLDRVKHYGPGIFTKSGLMVGLGESNEEVLQTLQDLRSVGCDIVTIGQYLQPSRRHLEVHEYVSPETFAEYKAIGESLGFKYVASAPFVRSSFNAREFSELYMMQSS